MQTFIIIALAVIAVTLILIAGVLIGVGVLVFRGGKTVIENGNKTNRNLVELAKIINDTPPPPVTVNDAGVVTYDEETEAMLERIQDARSAATISKMVNDG